MMDTACIDIQPISISHYYQSNKRLNKQSIYRDIVMRKETKKRQLIRQRLKSRSEENLADGEEPVPDSMEYASGLDEGLKGLSW